jgi:hypothetical protein
LRNWGIEELRNWGIEGLKDKINKLKEIEFLQFLNPKIPKFLNSCTFNQGNDDEQY